MLSFQVPEMAHNERLDRWLVTQFPDQSRASIQRWIAGGLIQVDGMLAKASQKLVEGQTVTVEPPAHMADSPLIAEALPLSIAYEDGDLLVIDKPAGLVVHPAPGHDTGTLVNAVLHHCPDLGGVGGERRPGIVHRLDKDTSGLIVVAKNDAAHRNLQAQFKARTIYKEYLALLDGRITPADGRISAPIGRHPVERKRMAILPADAAGVSLGREAVTDYHLLAVVTLPSVRQGGPHASFSYVRVVLHTGRTHQIRVHFAWLKHPVVGDTLYGLLTPRIPLSRQFLHAHKLRFRLPSDGTEREFVAPLPPGLAEFVKDAPTI
ncbi:MAG: RluA family pseudouridine synthase [Anaerolineales bacterium]|nr:RluA family pseudouridine synthase [Anaerolineales bacterium]